MLLFSATNSWKCQKLFGTVHGYFSFHTMCIHVNVCVLVCVCVCVFLLCLIAYFYAYFANLCLQLCKFLYRDLTHFSKSISMEQGGILQRSISLQYCQRERYTGSFKQPKRVVYKHKDTLANNHMKKYE